MYENVLNFGASFQSSTLQIYSDMLSLYMILKDIMNKITQRQHAWRDRFHLFKTLFSTVK